MHAMHQHLAALCAHTVDEVQCTLDHLLLDGNGEGQVEQAEHQAIVAVRYQVIGMASGVLRRSQA